MKKLVKYLGITVCVALFIFLMLPFLEPPTLNNDKANTEKSEQLIPQIFTSNPLTDIVKRIARFFGKKEAGNQSKNSLMVDRAGVALDARHAALPEDERNLLISAAAGANVIPADINAEDPTSYQVQDEEGGWVLVRQRMPEAAQLGMHEISVKDDAYERYVKQERADRFTPTIVKKRQQAVPDSKLARLFKPIKQFFGFDNDATAANHPQGSTTDNKFANYSLATDTGRTSRLGKNNNTPTRKAPKALEADLQPKDFQSVKKTGSSADIDAAGAALQQELDMLSVVNSAANLVANSTPSSGNSQQDQQQREQVRQDKWNEYTDLWKAAKEKDLMNRSGGQAAVDSLPAKETGCDVHKGLLEPVTEGFCSGEMKTAAELAEANRAHFLEQLALDAAVSAGEHPDQTAPDYSKRDKALSQAPLIPILGVADASSYDQIEIDQKDIDERSPQWATKMLYLYMLEQNNCSDNSCFWVANSPQPNPDPSVRRAESELPETVEAAGFAFQGDPLNLYPQIKQQWMNEQMAAYDEYNRDNPEATPEDRQQFEKDLQQAAPPYVLYSNEKAQQLAQRSRMGNHNQDAKLPHNAVVYFADAADAKAFSDRYGYDTRVAYGTTGHAVFTKFGPSNNPIMGLNPTPTEPAEDSLETRSRKLTDHVVNSVILFRHVSNEIQQKAHQEALQNVVTPKIQQIQKELQQQMKDIDSSIDASTYSR